MFFGLLMFLSTRSKYIVFLSRRKNTKRNSEDVSYKQKMLNILFIFAIPGSSSMAGMELQNQTDGKSNSESPGLNKGSSKRVNAVLHCKKPFFSRKGRV